MIIKENPGTYTSTDPMSRCISAEVVVGSSNGPKVESKIDYIIGSHSSQQATDGIVIQAQIDSLTGPNPTIVVGFIVSPSTVCDFEVPTYSYGSKSQWADSNLYKKLNLMGIRYLQLSIN